MLLVGLRMKKVKWKEICKILKRPENTLRCIFKQILNSKEEDIFQSTQKFKV